MIGLSQEVWEENHRNQTATKEGEGKKNGDGVQVVRTKRVRGDQVSECLLCHTDVAEVCWLAIIGVNYGRTMPHQTVKPQSLDLACK